MDSTIAEVMTRFPHSVGNDQPLSVAKELLQRYGIRHLPVKMGGKLIGIISDRDIHFALAWESCLPSELTVADIYIPDPYCVSPSTPIREVVDTMAIDKIGCTLIIENDNLVGIFTAVDACRVLSGLLKERMLEPVSALNG